LLRWLLLQLNERMGRGEIPSPSIKVTHEIYTGEY
jgi:hypothetical protein